MSLLALYASRVTTASEEPSISADPDRLEVELEQALQRLKQAPGDSSGPSSSSLAIQAQKDVAEDSPLGIYRVGAEAQMGGPGLMHAAGRVVTMAANKVMHAALRARDLSVAQEVADALRKVCGAP